MAYEKTYYVERLASLKTERESFIPHWKDLSEHLLTRQARFLTTDRNRGDKRNQKIINETGTLALRVLSSGMMSGMTNPSRPWLALRTPDYDLNEYRPVKLWLSLFSTRMLEILLRSNIYTTLPLTYKDQGCYGTTSYLALEDEESLIRSYHYPIGSYMLAANEKGRIDTCYREFEMTARQMIKKFGKENCSPTVVRLADQASGKETWIPVCHAIEANPDYDPRRAGVSYYKAYTSCYFEYEGSRKKFLKHSGFDYFPVMAPRWDVTGEDVYGSSPGMDALGTVRQLQLRERRKGQLIDKGTNPPMGAPSSMRDKRSSVLPGDVTYYDQGAHQQKFAPLYEPQPAFYQWVLEDIESCTMRIRRAFYEDLFLMLANDFRSNITAREIAEKHEEKLLQLGPVLLRQHDEHYDPLVTLIANIMFRFNLMPPPPPELSGQALNVEYTSLLSSAMKMVGVGSIERLTSFVGVVAGAKPEALDLLDEDAAIIEYANIIGAPPQLIRDRRVVEKIRADRRQQVAMQQALQSAEPAANTAKTLSQTNMAGDNALTRMSQMGAVQ